MKSLQAAAHQSLIQAWIRRKELRAARRREGVDVFRVLHEPEESLSGPGLIPATQVVASSDGNFPGAAWLDATFAKPTGVHRVSIHAAAEISEIVAPDAGGDASGALSPGGRLRGGND